MTAALSKVTPVVLTRDEAPNLGRTLTALAWARRVVVLDSGSTDATESIARGFPNVDWLVRPFDGHGSQWRHAIRETGIDTPYVLALDADMEVSPAFVHELATRFLMNEYAGGIVAFEYRYFGRALRGSVYPPQLRIFRPEAGRIEQVGHSQVFDCEGPVHRFRARIAHDDRKPLEDWIRAQAAYSALEAERIVNGTPASWRDRLREWGVAAPLVGAAAYIRSGGPLGGRASLRYACERAIFEALLAIRLANRRLEGRDQ